MTESINPTKYGYGPFEDFIKCFDVYANSVYQADLVRATDPDVVGAEPQYYVMPPIEIVRAWESPTWAGGDYGSQAILKFKPIGPLKTRDEEVGTKALYNIQVGDVIRWQEVTLALSLEVISSGEFLTLQQEEDFYKAVNIVSNFLPLKVGANKQLTYSSEMKSPLSTSIDEPKTLTINDPSGKFLPVMTLLSIGDGGYQEISSKGHGGMIGGLQNVRGRLFSEYTIKLLIRTKKPATV